MTTARNALRDRLDTLPFPSPAEIDELIDAVAAEARATADAALVEALLALREAAECVPYHRHPDKKPGEPCAYDERGHKEYTCPMCRALDRADDVLDRGIYGEVRAALTATPAAEARPEPLPNACNCAGSGSPHDSAHDYDCNWIRTPEATAPPGFFQPSPAPHTDRLGRATAERIEPTYMAPASLPRCSYSWPFAWLVCNRPEAHDGEHYQTAPVEDNPEQGKPARAQTPDAVLDQWEAALHENEALRERLSEAETSS